MALKTLGNASGTGRRMSASLAVRLMNPYLTAIALAVYAVGFAFSDATVQVAGVLLFFASNVVYGCLQVADRLMYLMLHAGIFLFLLTRPLVALFDTTRTWEFASYAITVNVLFCILLSLVCLRVGVACAALVRGRKQRSEGRRSLRILQAKAPAEGDGAKKGTSQGRGIVFRAARNRLFAPDTVRAFRYAALIIFVICFAVVMLIGYQRLNYMQGRAYEEYYLASMSDYSWSALGNFEIFLPYALCVYLATLPKKKPATVALLMFVITTVPMLLIGGRSDFVMAVLFLGVYYILRHYRPSEQEKWIGPFEKTLVCVGLPLGILAMGAINYIRADQNADGGALWLLGDALYKQGVTFRVMGEGFLHYPEIHALGFKAFVFWPLTYNITQGFIGQVFLGLPQLPTTNSAELALNGSSYAHTMSFFAHPNYLGGEGYGSCYLLELYTDFGFAGIAIFSVLLGLISVPICRMVNGNWFAGAFSLLAIYNVFHIARGATLEWCEFLFTTRFWMFIIAVVVLAVLLSYAFKRVENSQAVRLMPKSSVRTLARRDLAIANINELMIVGRKRAAHSARCSEKAR